MTMPSILAATWNDGVFVFAADTRRHELAWNYDLPKGKHTVRLKITNPSAEHKINAGEAIVFSDKPVNGLQANEVAARH